MRNRTIAILAGLCLLAMSLPAQAATFNIQWTADNTLSAAWYSVDNGAHWDTLDITSAPGVGHWPTVSTWTGDLPDSSSYLFAFQVENTGSTSVGNPAAMLMQITGPEGVLLSSQDWLAADVLDTEAPAEDGWVPAKPYGANGEQTIWHDISGELAPIDAKALWIGFSDFPNRTEHNAYQIKAVYGAAQGAKGSLYEAPSEK